MAFKRLLKKYQSRVDWYFLFIGIPTRTVRLLFTFPTALYYLYYILYFICFYIEGIPIFN